MRKWSIDDANELYNITGWGNGYFGINEKGNIFVAPRQNGRRIDLKEIIDELMLKDVEMPVLLRFPDILDDRIEMLMKSFEKSASEYDFKGKYYAIYPIKVNQSRPVVEEILRYGTKFNIGLEAGSKPELQAILALSSNPNALIICNGYKDEVYVELALLAKKTGKNVIIVVEKFNELKLIAKIAKKYNITPSIGVRVKLASTGSGKWEESGGDQSKFGLTSVELIQAIEFARKNHILDSINLVHFHIGSQVTNIRKIKNAIQEASQYFVELVKEGCNIQFVDIGGGLGVDYDGSRSSNPSSINYSVQEYLNDAIFSLQEVADKNNIPHPNLITESGRALTAHHSVLVFDVLEKTSLLTWNENYKITEDEHEHVQELYQILNNLTPANMLESWHDAQQIREETVELFGLGLLNLKNRALIESLFWTVAREINLLAENLKHIPDEFKQLPKMLADKYFCNFSLFQSLPDSWAIDQIFPIAPIHRLTEQPKRNATLQDITCDSDGKIDNFIWQGNFHQFLPLPDFTEDKPLFMGVFLIGAYQEILGDLHNLFGDTNAAHIVLTDDGYEIQQIIDGEEVADVLEYVQYNPRKLVKDMETWVSQAVKSGKISPEEGKQFLAIYRSGLYGYTYLI
ncbi:MAG: biosynthetic arginine decarboxylase [Chloroherpetonaceae bacterium]|jgi:arginine decarboxylase|nr:biosynthetic arginine decarboxylase [bacterium]